MKLRYEVTQPSISDKDDFVKQEEITEVEKEALSQQPYVQRAISQTIDSSRVRYGELTPTSQTQQYVESITDKLKLDTATTPIRVLVAPQWNDVNAYALPDGTIVLSGKLLKTAETEEEIAGVIAHEYVHIARGHASRMHAKTAKLKKDFKLESLTESIGMRRTDEYEADIRAVIEVLENAGINPTGYKQFIDRMPKFSQSLSHGSGVDRSLNIASVIHTVDLKSISSDLTPVDSELICDLDKSKNKYHPLLHKPLINQDAIRKNPELQGKITQWKVDRKEALDTVEIRDIPLIINHLRVRRNSLHKIDEETISILQKKFLTHHREEDEYIEVEKLQKIYERLIAVIFLSDLPEITKDQINSLVQLEELEDALEAILKLDFPYSDVSVEKMISFITQCNICARLEQMTIDDQLDIAGIKIHIQKQAKALSDIFKKFATYDAPPIDSLERSLYREFANSVQDERVMKALETDIQTPLKTITYKGTENTVEEKISGIYELIKSARLKHPFNFNMILEWLEPQVLDKTPVEIAEIAMNILNIWSNEYYHGNKKSNKQFEETDESNVVAAFIYQNLVFSLPQFSHLPPFEKKMLTFAFASQIGAYGYIHEINEYGKPTDATYEMAESLLNKDFLTNVNLDQLKQVYNYLLDGDYTSKNFGFEVGKEGFGGYRYGLGRDFTRMLITAVSRERKTLREFFDYIYSYEERQEKIEDILKDNRDLLSPLVDHLINDMETKQMDIYTLQEIIIMSSWVTDPFLKNALLRFAYNTYGDELSFDEKLNLLFPHDRKAALNDVKNQQSFIETDVRTKEQYHLTKERVKTNIDDILQNGRVEVGAATILSGSNTRFFNTNKFFEVALQSSDNEIALRRFIYNEMTSRHISSEDDDDEGKDKYDKSGVFKADKILRSLYNLDDFGREVLLRKLMTDEFGVLINPDKKRKFLDFLLSQWVSQDKENFQLIKVLDHVKNALKDSKQWELLYFALKGTMREKFAVPPPPTKQAKWNDLYEVEEDLRGSSRASAVSAELNWSSVPAKAQSDPEKHIQAYNAYNERRLTSFLSREGYLHETDNQRITPIELVKEVASKAGAPGVRFLQLLPQFVDIDDQYEKSFSEVYDSMQGQSKLAALMLLEREWPELWQNVESVGERIGGGSIATVYTIETHAGEKQVVKVRNPNITYHLDQTYAFATDILSRLKRLGAPYVACQTALDDIKTWINEDVNFKDFLSKDKKFNEQNSGFKPNGYNYEIKVPRSYEPQSEYFIREEYIEGKNLSEWDVLVSEGHDMKQIIGLIIRNYVSQVMQGHVHSDVHIGNFRVTPDRQVAVLDRNFFLELSDSERSIITGMFNPFIPLNQKVSELSKYLNSDHRHQDAINSLAESISNRNWIVVQKKLLELRQKGIKLPLNFSLLLKNFHVLQRLSQKAGFEDLMEAYFYQPT